MEKINLTNSICFFDVETTGLDISSDRIIEISIIKVNPDKSRVSLYFLINPEGKEIAKEATEKHGYTLESLADQPKFADVAGQINDFIKDCDLGGYNCVRFDIPILVEEFMRAGISYNPRAVNIIDAYKILIKKESRKLEHVYERMTGKNLENAHSAEADILATIEVFEHEIDKFKLPSTIEEIHKLTFEKPFVDLAGKFERNKDNMICFTFGKNRGKTINDVWKTDQGYFSWMLGGTFTNDTKFVIKQIIKAFEAVK